MLVLIQQLGTDSEAGNFINLPTSSFFSDVRLVIYDKPVEGTGNMYHYQSMIHDLLQYSKRIQKRSVGYKWLF